MTPPNELEQLAEFKDAIQSNKGLERLRAMQYLQQMNNQGLMEMPQVTEQPIVQRQQGSSISSGLNTNITPSYFQRNATGARNFNPYDPRNDMSGESGMEIGKLKEQRLIADQLRQQDLLNSNPNTLENIYKAADVIVNGGSAQDRDKSKEIYRANPAEVQRAIDEIRNNPKERAGGGQVAPDQMAQGLAGLGRYGDNMLLHINPEELEGLSSLGKITYNPITGLPEAWSLKSFFKPFKQAAKSVKKIAKSKAFRTIAPLALTIAAPYLAASFFPATFGVGSSALMAKGLAAQVAAMGPVAFGAATAIGSGLGALAGGAKPGDALKAAALSGVTAGGMRGFTNYMDPNIDSVFGPTYKGANAAGQAADTVGKVGNLQTSFGDVGTPAPSINKVASTGADFGQYGSTDSLVSPNYYSGSTGNQFVTGDLGISPMNVDPSLLETAGMPVPQYTSQTPSSFNVGNTGYSAGQAASPDAYSTLYNPSQTTQITPGGGDVGGRFGVASGDPSYTTPLEYTPPSIKEQAMDALTDNKVGRAVSRAGDYLEGTKVGDIGGAIYDDYSTAQGLGKLALIDSTIPDYQEQYAMEDARKRQLEELESLGYNVELSDEDTGFNQTVVVRDSSGKIMPQNLTLQDILDRAYGRTPRTKLTDTISYEPATATAKHGGLINLAHGGEFSGMVEGDGHGMEDNVYMPIKEQGQQVGTLAVSPSEYVVDAYTMSALGNGNANEGAKVMDGVVESVRKKAYGTMRQPNEINGLQALKPMMMGV